MKFKQAYCCNTTSVCLLFFLLCLVTVDVFFFKKGFFLIFEKKATLVVHASYFMQAHAFAQDKTQDEQELELQCSSM